MAAAGDGNYYYIESPVQLADIFQTELQGLMATVGQKVSLGLEPAPRRGRSPTCSTTSSAPAHRPADAAQPRRRDADPGGRPPRRPAAARGRGPASLLAVRLAWDSPRDRTRRVRQQRLAGLPASRSASGRRGPSTRTCASGAALLMVARAEKEASRAHERATSPGPPRGWPAPAYAAELPLTRTVADELVALDEIDAAFQGGDRASGCARWPISAPTAAPAAARPPDDRSRR